MKRFIPILLFSLLLAEQNIQLPMNIKGVRYNTSVPKPEEIIGHQIGTSHKIGRAHV